MLKFRSKAERRYAAEVLEPLRMGRLIENWAYERPIDLIVWPNGTVLRRHRPDFTLFMPDGTLQLHEVKGNVEQHWAVVADVIEALYIPSHPGVSYMVLDSRTFQPKEWRRRRKR